MKPRGGLIVSILCGAALFLPGTVRAQVTCLNGSAFGGGTVSLEMSDGNWYDFGSSNSPVSACNATSAGSCVHPSFVYHNGCPFVLGDVTINSTSWAYGQGGVSVSSSGATISGNALAGMGNPPDVDPMNPVLGCIGAVEGIASGGGSCFLRIEQPSRVTLRLAGDAFVSAPVAVSAATPLASFMVKTGGQTISISANASSKFLEYEGEGVPYVQPPGQGFSLNIDVQPTRMTKAILRAIEVTQSIQDWSNSVQLIAGKWTFARVYLENLDNDSLGDKLTGKLYGSNDNGPLPGSPLSPMNGGIFQDPILLLSDPEQSRLAGKSGTDTSLTFALPKSWTEGPGLLALRFDSDEAIIDPREPGDPLDVASNATVRCGFITMPHLKLSVFPLRIFDNAHPLQPPGPPTAIFQAVHEAVKMLPVSDIDWELAEPLDMRRPAKDVSGAMLNAINARRLQEGAPSNKLYMAVADPALLPSGLSEVGQANDLHGTHAWIAAGQLDGFSHELCHLLGNPHPGDPALGVNNGIMSGHCGEKAEFTSQADVFPYFNTVTGSPGDNSIVPTLGPLTPADAIVYGFTWQGYTYEILDPLQHYELMSYCHQTPRGAWISKWTYENTLGSILQLYSGPEANPLGDKKGSLGPSGSNFVFVRGTFNTTNNAVSWLPFQPVLGGVPDVASGPYELRVLDAGNTTLASVSFDIAIPPERESPETGFVVPVPMGATGRQLQLRNGATILATINASAHAPNVTLLQPNGGQNESTNDINMQWQASDSDGDGLTYSIFYSADGGAKWRAVALDLTNTSFTLAGGTLAASTNAVLLVSASDGFNVVSDSSDAPFTVGDSGPMLYLAEPEEGASYYADSPVVLEIMAMDRVQGRLTNNYIAWSSDLDGPLGTGDTVFTTASSLSEGTHLITVSARNDNGKTNSLSFHINIARLRPPILRVKGPPANGSVPLYVAADFATQLTLETSSNLVTWQPLSSFYMTNHFADVSAPLSSGGRQFFRARSGATPDTPPMFLSQPANVVTTNGDSFMLYGLASGTEPINYQWLYNGQPIAGATNSSLAFVSGSGFQSGSYSVVASNISGVLTSATSTVFVSGPDYEVLYRFDTNVAPGMNGWGPMAIDTNGWLYGCARNGGISNAGVIFRLRTNGQSFAVLRQLQTTSDGGTPLGGLLLASDGVLYGTCSTGGTNAAGTVFKLNRDGSGFAVLHHFLSSGDCRNPQAELLEGSDGRLYGTAYNGGGFGPGGLFVLNKNGTGYQILYGFKTTGGDGQGPLAGLIEGAAGYLYGTTEFGGASNKGCIFRISKQGTNYARLRDFGAFTNSPASSAGTLLQHSDGFLYGTTYSGGVSNVGTVFKLAPDGSTFITVLKSLGFTATEGMEPRAGLVETLDGMLLGTTRIGGSMGQGTVFKMGTDGPSAFSTVHDFGISDDGARSRGPLFNAGGVYYGSTFGGGTNDQGTVFRLIPP